MGLRGPSCLRDKPVRRVLHALSPCARRPRFLPSPFSPDRRSAFLSPGLPPPIGYAPARSLVRRSRSGPGSPSGCECWWQPSASPASSVARCLPPTPGATRGGRRCATRSRRSRGPSASRQRPSIGCCPKTMRRLPSSLACCAPTPRRRRRACRSASTSTRSMGGRWRAAWPPPSSARSRPIGSARGAPAGVCGCRCSFVVRPAISIPACPITSGSSRGAARRSSARSRAARWSRCSRPATASTKRWARCVRSRGGDRRRGRTLERAVGGHRRGDRHRRSRRARPGRAARAAGSGDLSRHRHLGRQHRDPRRPDAGRVPPGGSPRAGGDVFGDRRRSSATGIWSAAARRWIARR